MEQIFFISSAAPGNCCHVPMPRDLYKPVVGEPVESADSRAFLISAVERFVIVSMGIWLYLGSPIARRDLRLLLNVRFDARLATINDCAYEIQRVEMPVYRREELTVPIYL